MEHKYLFFTSGIAFVFAVFLITSLALQSCSYPIISKGVYSKNYTIEKISEETYNDILYDGLNNYFIIHSEDVELLKLDSEGNQVFKMKMNDCSLSNTSHYVFKDKGIIDLSKDSIVLEELVDILNADFTMKLPELKNLFNELYTKASVVIYDDGYFGEHKYDRAYFKIKDSWLLLFVSPIDLPLCRYEKKNREVILDRKANAISSINGMLEKTNRLLLLRDSKKGRYSNCETTPDSQLYPNYSARFPFPDDYLPCKRIMAWRSNIKAIESFPYTHIPIMWRMTGHYRLKVDKEVLKFKCVAFRGYTSLFNSSGMYWYRIPREYKKASAVSFLNVDCYNNAYDESEFLGQYIIKKKH